MLQYRTNAGDRRKPAIGRFGELTVEQACSIAQDWLADARKGKDPGAEKAAARNAPSVKELCTKFIEDYSKPKNRPRTVESNQGYIDRHIVPNLGTLKVREVTRSDVSTLVTRMKKTPATEADPRASRRPTRRNAWSKAPRHYRDCQFWRSGQSRNAAHRAQDSHAVHAIRPHRGRPVRAAAETVASRRLADIHRTYGQSKPIA